MSASALTSLSEGLAQAEGVPSISLVRGGPWFRIQRFLGLIPAGEDFAVRRRILVAVAVTWVPAIALLLVERGVAGVESADPVLGLLGAHARLLVALPLFIAAEPVFERGLQAVIAQLVRTGLVAPAAMPALARTLRHLEGVRDSWLVFTAIALLVAFGSWSWFFVGAPPEQLSWVLRSQGSAMALGYGGMWYLAVAKPVADLFLAHWLLRLALVAALLWKLSRLELDLVPAHPDGRAGLGFLEDLPLAFTPVVAGVSLTLAGELAREMLFRDQSLSGAIWLICA